MPPMLRTYFCVAAKFRREASELSHFELHNKRRVWVLSRNERDVDSKLLWPRTQFSHFPQKRSKPFTHLLSELGRLNVKCRARCLLVPVFKYLFLQFSQACCSSAQNNGLTLWRQAPPYKEFKAQQQMCLTKPAQVSISWCTVILKSDLQQLVHIRIQYCHPPRSHSLQSLRVRH